MGVAWAVAARHPVIPAYEWSFSDINPPVHAMGALKVSRAERVQRGSGDLGFLKRVFHKLLLNYAWWINRKDAKGHNLFEGGCLGLDNISVYDRSKPLPPGFSLKQVDATGWTGLVANLVMRRYRQAILECWKVQQGPAQGAEASTAQAAA